MKKTFLLLIFLFISRILTAQNLYKAVEKDAYQEVETLLKKGANPNKYYKNGLRMSSDKKNSTPEKKTAYGPNTLFIFGYSKIR